jgi:hypothetical protein
MTKEQFFTGILEQMFTQTQRKHDIHYKDGYGALIVPEGYPLEPRFVVARLHEAQIQMMMFSGGKVNIQF